MDSWYALKKEAVKRIEKENQERQERDELWDEIVFEDILIRLKITVWNSQPVAPGVAYTITKYIVIAGMAR